MSAESEAASVPSVPSPSVSPSAAIALSAHGDGSAEGHKLMYKWVMYTRSNDKKGDKKGSQDYKPNRVTDFDTVEQFWSLFNYLEEERVKLLAYYGSICFFREGIEPDWDAEIHHEGGRIVIEESVRDGESIMNHLREIVCFL